MHTVFYTAKNPEKIVKNLSLSPKLGRKSQNERFFPLILEKITDVLLFFPVYLTDPLLNADFLALCF